MLSIKAHACFNSRETRLANLSTNYLCNDRPLPRMRCENWKLITNLPAFVTIISVPRAKKSSHKFFISMSTLTFAREQDNGLVGGVEEVEHRSFTLRVKSWSDLVVSLLIVGEFSGIETFFPVPAFRSLSKQWRKNQGVISDVCDWGTCWNIYSLTFHIFRKSKGVPVEHNWSVCLSVVDVHELRELWSVYQMCNRERVRLRR